MPSTKIEFNCNKIGRIQGLDELAQLLFPGNRSQQRVFLAFFIELKYAPAQFLPHLSSLCDRYGFSPRMLETVSSKLRRLGIIDHVSRFNKSRGYREGWVFSTRFSNALLRLAELSQGLRDKTDGNQEQKDRDLFMYVWRQRWKGGGTPVRPWICEPNQRQSRTEGRPSGERAKIFTYMVFLLISQY